MCSIYLRFFSLAILHRLGPQQSARISHTLRCLHTQHANTHTQTTTPLTKKRFFFRNQSRSFFSRSRLEDSGSEEEEWTDKWGRGWEGPSPPKNLLGKRLAFWSPGEGGGGNWVVVVYWEAKKAVDGFINILSCNTGSLLLHLFLHCSSTLHKERCCAYGTKCKQHAAEFVSYGTKRS